MYNRALVDITLMNMYFSDRIVSARECQCSVNVASDCPKCHDETDAGSEMLDQGSRTPGRGQRYVICLQVY